ncbi:MAG: hypothetical protein WDO18_20255 [Acidobacteriota bacterium]
MTTRLFPFLLGLCLAASTQAQVAPTIRSVANAASNTDALLPNSAIARGSMFVIKGENMGPPAITVANTFPLLTTYLGTSIKVTTPGNEKQFDAIIYYTGTAQVAAILPSAVPEGQASLRLTYNGLASQTFNINVVKSNFGAFTINSSGAGESIAFNASNALGVLSPVNPAKPGDILSFWGTGLGPIDADETKAAPQFDMTTVPVQAWVGGKTADIVFRGRNSCCTAVDTIYIRVPAGVSGCVTPVTFKVGDQYTNTTLIPTTQSGNLCSPNSPTVTQSDLSQLVTKTSLWYGSIFLNRSSAFPNTSVQPVGTTADQGVGVFTRLQVYPGWVGFTNWDVVHPRSCNVVTSGGLLGSGTFTFLDAGQLSVNGPAGFASMNRDPLSGGYYGLLGGSGQYVVPGTFTVTSGFLNNDTATVSLTYTTPVVWTNFSQLASIDRNAGATITWTGGDPNGFVQVFAYGTLVNTQGGQVATGITCVAPSGDHSFTIPPYILAALPPTQAGNPAILGISGFAAPKKISGGGLDLTFAAVVDHAGINVTYR